MREQLILTNSQALNESAAGDGVKAYQATDKFTPYPIFFFSALLHVLAVMGLIFIAPTLTALIAAGCVYLLTGLGITIGYHRCLTHRAFAFKYRWIERIFATLGVLSMQGGPIWWCSLHRIHHKYSDRDSDPHDSRKGFWYSQILWLAHLDPRWRYMHSPEKFQHVVKDIASDRYYYLLDKYQLGSFLILTIWAIFYVVGGWTLFFWAGPIAMIGTNNVTWLVNSVTHKLGYVSYNAHDNSKNNPLVGVLAHGEGWHNNHHAFPASAKQGFFRWWEFDLSYLVIRALKGLGCIEKMNLPTPSQQEKRIESVMASRLDLNES